MRALLALLLLVYTGLSFASQKNNSKKITLPLNKWASQRVLSHAIGQILERRGYQVDYIDIELNSQWGALRRGLVHFQLEVWEPSMKNQFSTLTEQKHIIDMGTHDVKVKEDWWYPDYVKIQCPGLPDWKALNNCKELFKSDDSGKKGRYLAGPWDYADADIIRGLGIEFTIERVEGSKQLWQQLKKSVADKSPILMLNWSPNWTDNAIKGEFVKFPVHHEMCEKEAIWGINKLHKNDCGNPHAGWLKKAAWKGLKNYAPCVFQLVQSINFSNQMIADASSFSVVEQLTDKEAATKWRNQYQQHILFWLKGTCLSLNAVHK